MSFIANVELDIAFQEKYNISVARTIPAYILKKEKGVIVIPDREERVINSYMKLIPREVADAMV